VSTRRVAVTGLGVVSPVGNDRGSFWRALVAGQSGIRTISAFDADQLPSRVAGEVRDFDADALLGKRDVRKMDRSVQFAAAAAAEAIADARLPEDREARDRIGVIVATGFGSVATMLDIDRQIRGQGPRHVSPFGVPKMMENGAAATISLRHGLHGPSCVVSSACASTNDAIGEAFRAIAYGDADAMVTGGTEAAITELIVGGFCSEKALSTRNGDPARASRPFDAERDGFVISEGAGILVLEELESAVRRGAHIYAEMRGIGQSADAHHMVAPDPAGEGVALALRRALKMADLRPQDVSYINAHATSTPLGDAAESRAIESVFAGSLERLAISSTKSMTGHLCGAAGAVEAVATILAVAEDVIPPTINYEAADPECRLDYVPNVARRAPVEVGLSNGFGFGGHNSVAVFAKYRG
jgi:3-oxoacyl-[acyl-carrier-protein] synthase II